MNFKGWLAGITGLILAVTFAAGVAQAGFAGPDVDAQGSGAPLVASSPPKPYAPVSTTAQSSSCTTSGSACPDTPCVSGHSCGCVSFTNFAMKLPSTGAISVNAEFNADFTDTTSTGVGSCLFAYGAGTGTVKSGDKINFNYNGQLCTSGSGIDATSGTWLVTGGTGKLVNASGTGLFSVSHKDTFGTFPCVDTMDGTYRATP
jgi:hypothetical protein